MGFQGKVEVKAVYESEKVLTRGVFKPRDCAHSGQVRASLRKKKNKAERQVKLVAEASSLGMSVDELLVKKSQQAQSIVPATEKERIQRLAKNFPRHNYY
jgi:hypothetical protein